MQMIRILGLIAVLAMAVPVASYADEALGLNGTNALAREGAVASPSLLDLLTFTVEAWVFPSLPGRTMNVASDSAYVLRICSGPGDCRVPPPSPSDISGVQLFLFTPGVNEPLLAAVAAVGGQPNSIIFGEWNHIAASFNSTTRECTLSVNGVVNLLPNCLAQGLSLDVGFDQRFGIGVSDASDQAGTEPIVTDNAFDGQISGFRISNSVRYTVNFTPTCPADDAATRALWLFQGALGSTSFPDSSGAGHTLTGLNGAALTTAAAGIPCGGTGGQPTDGDLNGDGKADIVWRGPGGSLVFWLMNGGAIGSVEDAGVVTAAWHLDAIADLNGDGTADIVWRGPGGEVVFWLMNGGAVASMVNAGVQPATWQIAGSGDLNGDGNADIVWRGPGGALVFWLMNSAGAVGSVMDAGVVAATWQLDAIADLNGDGTDDIVWRGPGGEVVFWLMNNGSVASMVNAGVQPATWQIAGSGDLNGDGTDDIVWRGPGGVVVFWLMNVGMVASVEDAGVVAAAWQLAQVGDLNGDGTDDIVWRGPGGEVVFWLMEGGSVASLVDAGVQPTTWTIEAGLPD